jgi:mono/diheme cytochrome c family protein
MTSKWRRSGPTAAVTVFILAHAAAAGAPTPTDQGNLGEETYMDNCAMCHEPDGAGIPELAPPLIDNPRVADAASLEKVIREGISGPTSWFTGRRPPRPQRPLRNRSS